ncbi:phage holin family protein [Anaerosporobacter sp.]|uniref:phage holin family protein n=1 Tax=Anaerosporobacter sp. TaxID=1872529 RepID=UPI00286F1B34|nr:phage holin family protein [Anaerosporobacter sp.]
MQIEFIGVLGVVGAFFVQLFGGWTQDLKTLLVLMSVDFIMGLLIGFILKKSSKTITGAGSSKACWTGLVRKGGTLLIVLVGYQLDNATKLGYIRSAVIIAFIINETISIIENAGIMGIPIPTVIIKAIDVLKDKAESEEN